MALSKTKKPTTKPVVKKEAKTTVKETSMTLPVYTLKGDKKGTISLNKEIFGVKVNEPLMLQAVRVYMVNQRQGTASTKNRGEVIGSTRKIYRQKGTGRARHGAIKAPIFVGGGIAFGPRPRDFDLKFSKQMRKKSLFSALSAQVEKHKVYVVDASDSTGKTKEMYGFVRALNILDNKGKGKALFVTGENMQAKRAVKNIDGLKVDSANSLNTYEVLNSNSIVFEKSAIEQIEKVFLAKK